ncbi:MAG: chromate transporter [Kiritimatiellae bacterium]|nr:chromate transporter [Kiritimatiellia bacterium]
MTSVSPARSGLPPALADRPRRHVLGRLFVEWFKIALTVIGGGYAIIIVADDVFGKRLRWLDEGELLERLPLFQTIPGLIAGNSAMYVGMRLAGVAGAAVALVAIALPSLIVITAIAMAFAQLPAGNPVLDGAFIGLRCALCGIVVATIAKSWRRIVNGLYGWIAVPLFCVLIIGFKVPAGRILVAAIAFGVLVFTLGPRVRGRLDGWRARPR